MRRFAKLFAAFTAALLVPAFVYAQAAQGQLTGVVKDTSGAVLPGVTVEASSPVLIEKTRTVVTDGTGQYRFVGLFPGNYTLTFSLAGFNTIKREGLEVSGAFVATVNVEMRVGALEETITVSGETPLVDVQSATRERVLTREVMDAVPSARIPYDLAALTPGVTMRNGGGTAAVQDVGGTAGNQQANSLVVHGSKPVDMRLTYNGLTLATLETGKNAGAVNNSTALQEVTVDSSAVSAELATGGVRINLVPREGSNTFKGSFFGSYTNGSLQGNNYNDALKAAGLLTPGSIDQIYDFNPGFGGPIKQDKIWFFVSARDNAWKNNVTGIFGNANAFNANAWTYVADPSKQVKSNNFWLDFQGRLTWQATPRNKFALTYNPQYGHTGVGGSATQSPEAATESHYNPKANTFVDWTSPITNRLLFEAVAVDMIERNPGFIVPDVTSTLIGVTEQSTGLAYRGVSGASSNLWNSVVYYRASVSYITGAHLFKVGFNNANGQRITSPSLYSGQQPISFRFNNGVPNQITELAVPYQAKTNLDADGGIFAQDKWTVKRLTVNLGVRFDYYKSSFPEEPVGPGPLAPTRNFVLPASDGVRGWKDITPKSGIVYDLFGNGKTALRASVNKYLQGQALGGDLPDRPFGYPLNPVYQLINSATRSWTDTNRNFVPDCNLTNPAAQTVVGGDVCGALSNSNFGTIAPSTTYDPAVLGGWGSRAYNWEFSAGVQHQILPRVSVDVGYFRRIFGNLLVTDNLTVAASDYSRFTFTAPTDSRLPGGGGYSVTSVDLNPNKFGLPASLYRTFSDNYGKMTDHWDGIDFNANARLVGLLIQGGFSTGKTTQDTCAVIAQIPEMQQGILGNAATVWTPAAFCHYETPYLVQYKVLGTYTVPKWDVQVSSTFQSVPGPEVIGNFVVTTAVAAQTLGRPLSGSAANTTVNVVNPGTVFGDRHNQLDLRFAKILKFAKTRTALNVDLYNALNANPVLSENANYAAFRAPTAILPARFVKFSAQFDF